MYKVCFLLLSIPLLFISCNNDDDASEPAEEANFYALTIGNSWNYEYFQRNTTTNEFETMDIIEEVLITETTEVSGETFFAFQSTTTGNDNNNPFSPENGITVIQKRDSVGYLIDTDHSIIFSNENLTDYLISENEWGDVYGVLKEDIENIEVEAGSFNVNRNEIYALLAPAGEISEGRDNKYYSDEIGEVYRKFSSVSSPEHRWEKRLISFEIID